MTIAQDLNALLSNRTMRPPLEGLMKPGKIRNLSSYGNTTTALKEALAVGAGTLWFDVSVDHDQSAAVQAIKIPSDVAVLPMSWDSEVELRCGVSDTAVLLEAPLTTKNAVWAVNLNGNGSTKAATHGFRLRRGCILVGAHITGFLGQSATGVSLRDGGGLYNVRSCTFSNNYVDIANGTGAVGPDNGSVFDITANDHSDGVFRGAYLSNDKPSFHIKHRSNIYRPPITSAVRYTPAWFATTDRALNRYAEGSTMLGNCYIGNDLAHENSRDYSDTPPNGIVDTGVVHASDGLLQKNEMSCGGGEAAFSTSLLSDGVIKEDCIALETDTGFAIGAREVAPVTAAETITTSTTLTRCIAYHCALDRADEHSGGNAAHPGGGRHGFIGDTVDGVIMSGCAALGKYGGKMRFGASFSRSINVDFGDLIVTNAIDGASTAEAP